MKQGETLKNKLVILSPCSSSIQKAHFKKLDAEGKLPPPMTPPDPKAKTISYSISLRYGCPVSFLVPYLTVRAFVFHRRSSS